jgi:purine nucleosidase
MKSIQKIILLLVICSQCAFAQNHKIIFDCDLGDDIDDAYALSLLLASKDVDLMGITTAFGRTEDRAVLACKILYDLGLDKKIPVYAGRNTSKTSERANWYADQYYWSEGFKLAKAQPKSAADFIIETLRKNPNQITLIAVGPLTNLGDVLAKDPGALKLAKRIVLMFGSFYTGFDNGPTITNEWNVKCDIAASRQIINAGLRPTCAGLDITCFVSYNKATREKLLCRQTPMTNTLTGLQSLWNYDRDPILFDAVAVGMVLWPDLFKTRAVNFTVDEQGYTIIHQDQAANADVGVSIDKNEFLKRLTDVFMHQNLGRN